MPRGMVFVRDLVKQDCLPMNSNRRSFITAIGAIFTAGFVHSVLPMDGIWLRAAITGTAALATGGLLVTLLPRSPDP